MKGCPWEQQAAKKWREQRLNFSPNYSPVMKSLSRSRSVPLLIYSLITAMIAISCYKNENIFILERWRSLHQSVFKEAAVSLTSRCSKQKGLQIFTNAETTAFPKLIQRESNVFFWKLWHWCLSKSRILKAQKWSTAMDTYDNSAW